MEKKEFGILIAFILGIFVIVFFGRFTGGVINESIVECNAADFNADGEVNYLDKVDFAKEYDLNYGTENFCGVLDVNEDRILNILDSNKYSNIYAQNYGTQTGACVLRKLACEKPDLNLEAEPSFISEEQTKLSEEKPNFFNWIKSVFKNSF